MPTTIGHLQLVIGATHEKLQGDMRKGEAIVDKSAKKMTDDVKKRGNTMWGAFFRGAFAMAMFKRFVNVVREGTKALEDSNDAAAKAAREGLAQYDAGLKKISATAAKHLAPVLGKIGEGMEFLGTGIDALVDIFEHQVFGGGEAALVEALRKRDEIQRKLAKGPLIQGDFGNQQAFMKQTATLKASLAELVPPTEKFIELTDRARRMLLDQSQATAIFDHEFKKLLSTLGLAAEVDPFAKWGESLFELSKLAVKGKISFKDLASIVQSSGQQLIKSSGLGIDSEFGDFQKKMQQLNQLRRAGAIDDAQLFRMIGNQTEKLLGDRIQARLNIQPDLMQRGSAEALGTIAAFRGPQATEADFEKELLKLQKEEVEAAKRQQKIGERIARAVEKQPPVVGR